MSGCVPNGVCDLGVKLNGVDGLGLMANGGIFRVLGGGNGVEALWELAKLVTVRHPL